MPKMTKKEVVEEIESALEREKDTRGGVVLDCSTARNALEIIGGLHGTEARWIVAGSCYAQCSYCGRSGSVGYDYCPYCGAHMVGLTV